MAVFRIHLVAAALAAAACTAHAGCNVGDNFDRLTGLGCESGRPATLDDVVRRAVEKTPNAIETNDGHVFITSQNVKQNVTDLLGRKAAAKLFDEQADNLKSLDESISPRLLDVERKSVKNVAELLGELVEGNKQVTASTDKNTREIVKELAAIRSAMGAKSTSVTAGVVQFVTKCVPTGVCGGTAEEEINAVLAGDAFEHVQGIYKCKWTNPAKKVLMSPAVAKTAGPEGFAIVTCAAPPHGPDYVTGKTWTSQVDIMQNSAVLKYGGKSGENKVDFRASPPTITGVPTATIETSIGVDSAKFSFALKINDPDTKPSDLKITVQTTNTKFMPGSSIKIGTPAADGTRVFSVTPDIKNKGSQHMTIKITVSVEDKFGLKAAPAVINAYVKVSEPLMKLCTTDGAKRTWVDSGWWDNSGTHASQNAATMEKLIAYRGDVKTAAYNKPVGGGVAIIAYIGTKEVGRATYNIMKEFQGNSLRQMVASGSFDNKVIGKWDKARSSTNRPMRTNHLNSGHDDIDMFVDTSWDLVTRHSGLGGAHSNRMRLGTKYTNAPNPYNPLRHGGGHTFGGIGGTHYHGSWQVDFEAAPITAYCNPRNQYGNNAFHRHRSHYVYSSCTQSQKKTINVDYIIIKT